MKDSTKVLALMFLLVALMMFPACVANAKPASDRLPAPNEFIAYTVDDTVPFPPASDPPCSDACSCGCQDGGVCDCGNVSLRIRSRAATPTGNRASNIAPRSGTLMQAWKARKVNTAPSALPVVSSPTVTSYAQPVPYSGVSNTYSAPPIRSGIFGGRTFGIFSQRGRMGGGACGSAG